jgi:hypothetical protein
VSDSLGARGRRRRVRIPGRSLFRPQGIGEIAAVLSVIAAALALRGFEEKSIITAVIAVLVIRFVFYLADSEGRRQRKLEELTADIQARPVVTLLSRSRDAKRTKRELKRRFPGITIRLWNPANFKSMIDYLVQGLREEHQLCVIRLREPDICAPPDGTDGPIAEYQECTRIVESISAKLENAPELGDAEKEEVLANLRTDLQVASKEKDSGLGRFMDRVVDDLRSLDHRLVPLVEIRPAALKSRAGDWMLELFQKLEEDLGWTYGAFIEDSGKFDDDNNWQDAKRYIAKTLKGLLSEEEYGEIRTSLLVAVDLGRSAHMGALKIRCAVIAVAERDGDPEPKQRLCNLSSSPSAAPEDCMEEAVLEARWLIDRKASRLARGGGVIRAFDRLAVTGATTAAMLRVALWDLGLDQGAEELYEWLRCEEFERGEVIEKTDDAIWLSTRSTVENGPTMNGTATAWLKEQQQAEAYQSAQVAAERSYRECLVLDRTHVPAPGYAKTAPGYSGFHLFENPAWWRHVDAWSKHVTAIVSPESRRDAGVAVTCLFLEAWWWSGDTVRGQFVDDALNVAQTILQDQPEWIAALHEFDQNYEPNFNLRVTAPDARDKWQRVGHALDFLADKLDLRQGHVPTGDDDRARCRARIYVCWCSFNGDVAKYTGSPEVADGWFRDAAEACGQDPDNAVIAAYSRYEQADAWIPSAPARSLRLIEEYQLQKAAERLGREADDQTDDGGGDGELRAHLARMYGDIRWETGDIGGAFDAYGRALLLAYVYQVDQETSEMAPSLLTSALYEEMQTRFLQRLDEAQGTGGVVAADAAIERIRNLFGPYWELKRTALAKGRLAGVVPPLPVPADLDSRESGYAKDALEILKKLKDRIDEPVDRLLQAPATTLPVETLPPPPTIPGSAASPGYGLTADGPAGSHP